MPDLPNISVEVTSVEAGQGGNGIVNVRISNPYADTGLFLRVPVKNLNADMPNILKEAATQVKIFADQLAIAAGQSLRFSQK